MALLRRLRVSHVLVSALCLGLVGAASAVAAPGVASPVKKVVKSKTKTPGLKNLVHRGSVWIPCHEMSAFIWPEDHFKATPYKCYVRDRDDWVELAATVNFPVTDQDEAWVQSATCRFKSPNGLKYKVSFGGNWQTVFKQGRIEHKDAQDVDVTPPKTPLTPSQTQYNFNVKFRMDTDPKQPFGDEVLIGCRVNYLIKNPWLR